MNFKVVRNDITSMAVDAIVCPSNPKLKEGSGTSAAIFGKAGRSVLAKACSSKLVGGPRITSSKAYAHHRKEGSIRVGSSVVTSAYALPSKIIIHTVVPKWRGGRHGEYDKLCEAYVSALVVADRTSCESLAIPLLAAGNMGFKLCTAIKVATGSIEAFEPRNTLKDVTLVTYGSSATQLMRDLGYAVDEVIDERYVQENDESYKPAAIHAAADAMVSARQAVNTFADKAAGAADAIAHDQDVQKFVKKIVFKAMEAVADNALADG